MTFKELLTIEPPTNTQEEPKPTTWYVSVKGGFDFWITFDKDGKATYRKGLKYNSPKEITVYLDEIANYTVNTTSVRGTCQNIYLTTTKGR